MCGAGTSVRNVRCGELPASQPAPPRHGTAVPPRERRSRALSFDGLHLSQNQELNELQTFLKFGVNRRTKQLRAVKGSSEHGATTSHLCGAAVVPGCTKGSKGRDRAAVTHTEAE